MPDFKPIVVGIAALIVWGMSATAHAAPALPLPVDPTDIRNVEVKAETGDVVAQLQAGLDYNLGQNGAPLDVYKAMYWFKRAGAKGNDRARGEYNQLKAEYDDFLVLRAKAFTGDATAEVVYAQALSGSVTADVAAGAKIVYGAAVFPPPPYVIFDSTTSPHNWYRRAALQGNAEGEYTMGVDAYRAWIVHSDGDLTPQSEDDAIDGNLESGLEWLNRSATHGNVDAQSLLALVYGMDTPAHDDQLARHWLETAAPASERSEGLLCQLAYDGVVVAVSDVIAPESHFATIKMTPDYDRAFSCFSRHINRSPKAAAQSYWYLAEAYHLGRGTAHNDEKAIELFTVTISKQPTTSGLAELELARIYAASPDIPRDVHRSYQLYSRAIADLSGGQQRCTPLVYDPVDGASQRRMSTALAKASDERQALVKQMSSEERLSVGIIPGTPPPPPPPPPPTCMPVD